MKVIILAGGKGSRLSEYTKLVPKPMVKILKIPIIVRIINHYLKYGFNDFLIAGGYKSKIIHLILSYVVFSQQIICKYIMIKKRRKKQ